ncbi:hypothetical protein LTR37_005177 [Vermiconidia calcicola]|uniref:Uncharacterized protein n=1 Tax=Vermiconidia calcicola TaxID=1690605 RepID=A0ACC3NKG1_9PEZI|nr:hypothetical protein LTR37_005177 [Vermiconidia calcicola]
MSKAINPLSRRRETPSPLKAWKRESSRGGSGKSSLQRQKADEERLDDTGSVPSLVSEGVPRDVNGLVRYIHAHMWSEIPDRAAGMNSERISEILRFRQALPRIVSVAHLHALSVSNTATERELATLLALGAVRRVVVPGRGKGGAAIGEGIALAEDWKTSVMGEAGLRESVKNGYLALMDAHPASATAPTSSLPADEIRELVHAGYFISPSALSSNVSNLTTHPSASPVRTLSRSGSMAATGTLAAIGGSGAVHESGGSGSTLATRDTRQPASKSLAQQTMTFSLPSTGRYLKLLTSARLHLLSLLKQLSPRYKEATLSLLKERWDGNIPSDATSTANRTRGEWTGVLPGKTKKWKEFYGLGFEWVLEECVGSGLLELFDTGSVGLAVRAS